MDRLIRRARVPFLAVVVGLWSVLAGTASAQTDDDSGQSVLLVSQSASVESDGTIDVTVDWLGELSDELSVSVLFHQRIGDEADIGAPNATILNRRSPVQLGTLPSDPDGNFVISIPIRSERSGSGASDGRTYLPGPGVYPFTVEVRSAEGLVSSVSSTVFRLPQDRSELRTIDFAIVLALSPADGLNLSDGLWFLSVYPDVPFVVQLDGGVLTQLESDPELANQFASAALGRPVMTEAGIDLDPSALAEIDQGRFFTQAVNASSQRLERLGLTPLPEIVMSSSDVTVEGADLMQASGIRAVLGTRTNGGDVGSITTPSGTLQVVQPDRQLSNELSSPRGFARFSANDIYELYSRLSLRATADSSSVRLGGEGAPVLDSLSLDSFLATLTEDGPLRPVSLIDALETQARNPLLAAERPEQDLLASGAAISELQQLAETSRSFRGVQNPELEQLLVDSLSRTRNPSDRARAIDRAKAELLSDLAAISLPATKSFHLAAVEGPLPLTIRNDAEGTRLIRLQVRGDRVDIAENGEVLTIPPGETKLDLHATARALGVSTLEVTATTPDGERILSTSRYQIRSTAVPGLGWAISGTALVFLLLWWLRNARKSKPRRPHLVGIPSPADRKPPPQSPTIAAETVEAM